ncbi:DUF5316 family protein [Gracilibacillus lacisalsi]|uniref:DUF5316 family protein n=1 Tax=Gracilibacillus lacisalsi TaxID=393087 RepID=UPI0003615A3D|nr:DUF5316 family protein [Gracilibacillus lacisalsi]
MRYFLIGIIFAVIGVLLSIIIWGVDKAYVITGGIGIVFIGISMIFSGALLSGDRMRANYATESAKDRRTRNTVTFRAALIGITNLIIALLIYYIIN